MTVVRKISVLFFKIYSKIVFRVKIVGSENIPKVGGCILCPNHVSLQDPPTVGSYTKRMMYIMAKKDLFKGKFLKWYWNKIGVFPVDRAGKDLEAIKTSLRILKRGDILMIYPEGTRHGLEKGIKPKSGAILIAIKAGVPIIPLGIQGNFKAFKKVVLNYGKPIDYSNYKNVELTKELQEKLINELMQEIIRLTNEKK